MGFAFLREQTLNPVRFRFGSQAGFFCINLQRMSKTSLCVCQLNHKFKKS